MFSIFTISCTCNNILLTCYANYHIFITYRLFSGKHLLRIFDHSLWVWPCHPVLYHCVPFAVLQGSVCTSVFITMCLSFFIITSVHSAGAFLGMVLGMLPRAKGEVVCSYYVAISENSAAWVSFILPILCSLWSPALPKEQSFFVLSLMLNNAK